MTDETAQAGKEDVYNEEIVHIIIEIPKETAKLDITATMFDNNAKPVKYISSMTPSEIYQARKDFLDYVDGGDDYDAQYALTDKGRELLSRIDKGESIDWGEILGEYKEEE